MQPNLDCIGFTSVSQAQSYYRLAIMPNMGMRAIGNRKTYTVRGWLQAIDRLLKASSMTEKEYAIRWSTAWSTAYLGRMERRRNENRGQSLDGLERRRRNRFQS